MTLVVISGCLNFKNPAEEKSSGGSSNNSGNSGSSSAQVPLVDSLVLEGPSEIFQNICSDFEIKYAYPNGNIEPATSNLVFNLQNTVAGQAYQRGTNCGTPITSIALNTGERVAQFEFLATNLNAGTLSAQGSDSVEHSLTVSAPGTSGSIDTSFASSGAYVRVSAIHYGELSVAKVLPDGKILGGGFNQDSTQHFYLARFLANGSLDTSFGTSGEVELDFPGTTSSKIIDLLVLDDGKIIAGGTAQNSTPNSDFAMAKFNQDGTLDTSFGANLNGMVLSDFNGSNQEIHALEIDSSGRIYASGWSANGSIRPTTVRYLSNGTIDTSYGSSGVASAAVFASNAEGFGSALQDDGKIVLVGRQWNSGTANFEFITLRFTAAGALDTGGFNNPNGYQSLDIGSGHDVGDDVVIQSDGKIVVAGYANEGTEDIALARFNTNGTLDTTFSGDGIHAQNIGGNRNYARSIVLDKEERILVTGDCVSSGFDASVARFTTAGALDTSFNTTGYLIYAVAGHDFPKAVAFQPDGRIVFLGSMGGYSGQPSVVRVWP